MNFKRPTEVWVLLVRRGDIPYLNRLLCGLNMVERHIREAQSWNVRQVLFWLEPPMMPYDQALKIEMERRLNRLNTRFEKAFVRVIHSISDLTIHEAEKAMAAPMMSLFSQQWMSRWSVALGSHFHEKTSYETIFKQLQDIPEMDEWKETQQSTVFYIPLKAEKDWIFAQKRLGVEIVEMSRSGFLGKNINRKISLFMSRFLVQLDIAPVVWTWVNIGFGLIAAMFLAQSHYAMQLTGALFFLWTCIFDGVDGEVARFRFETSEKGALLDMSQSWFNTLLAYGAILLSLVGRETMLMSTAQLLLMGCSILLIALSLYFISVVRVPIGQGAWSMWEERYREIATVRWFSLLMRKDTFSLLAVLALIAGQPSLIAWGALVGLFFALGLVGYVEWRARNLFAKTTEEGSL